MVKTNGKPSKSEMLAKIADMKLELARKKKKLKKSQRVAHIKAHIQQKLKEHNDEGKVSIFQSEDPNFIHENEINVINEDNISFTKEKDSCTDDPKKVLLNEAKNVKGCDLSEANCSSKARCLDWLKSTDSNKALLNKKNVKVKASDNCDSALKFSDGEKTDELVASATSSNVLHSYSADTSHIIENVSRHQQEKLFANSGDSQLPDLASEITSPTSSFSFKSDDRRISPVSHSYKSQNNISNSEFLEILGVSQSIELTPAETMTNVREMKRKSMVLKNNENQKSDDVHESSQSIPYTRKVDKVGDNKNESESFYEYTELDAISYSQFELTEDFLSENPSSELESHCSQGKSKRFGFKPLIKRKSPRISSISYNRKSISNTCNLSPENTMLKNGVHSKKKRQLSADEKVAAVLSVIQYLIDDVKRQGEMEFKLPSSFETLMKLKSKCRSNVSNENLDQVKERSVDEMQIYPDKNVIMNRQFLLEDNNSFHTSNYVSSNGNVGHENSCGISSLMSNATSSDTLSVSISSSESDMNEKQQNSVRSVFSRKQKSKMKDALKSSQIQDMDNSDMDSSFISSSLCVMTEEKQDYKCSPYSPSRNDCSKVKSLAGFSNGREATNISQVHNLDDLNTTPKAIEPFIVSLGLSKRDMATPCKIQYSFSQNKMHNQSNSNDSCRQNVSLDESLNCHEVSRSQHVPSLSSTPIPSVKQKLFLSNHCANTEYENNSQTYSYNELHYQCERKPHSTAGRQSQHNNSLISKRHDLITCRERDYAQKDNEVNSENLLLFDQTAMKMDASECDKGRGVKLSEISLLASPILRCNYEQPSPRLCKSQTSKNPSITDRISEAQSRSENIDSTSPQLFKLRPPEKSLPKPFSRNKDGFKEREAALHFTGCFQSCSQDPVVQLLYCEVLTPKGNVAIYIVCVQTSTLSIWSKDTCEWTQELDWRLSSNIHILDACCLALVTNKIGVAAYGWEDNQLFATTFVYDIKNDVTSRFDLPISDDRHVCRNVDKLYFCCVSSTHLLIGISCYNMHTIRSVYYSDGIKSIESTHLFEPCRGSLKGIQVCQELHKACIALTGDQKIVIWNLEIASVIKSIQMPISVPCLTRLLGAKSYKGYVVLTVSWTKDKFDFVGVVLVNPVTGGALKYYTYKNPNSGWKRLQDVKSVNNCVVATSQCGSVSWWDQMTGTLIGYRRSQVASSATVIGNCSVIIGELEGCLHSYAF